MFLTPRKPVRLALTLATLHGLIALAVTYTPGAYGSARVRNVAGDTEMYYSFATRVLGGEVPYRDFRVEYPILSLPFFLAPRLFVNTFREFKVVFGAEMLLADALAMVLLIRRLSGDRSREVVNRRLAWYSLALITLFPMAIHRFDLAVMAWAFGAAIACVSGRWVLAGVLAGTGTLTKIVPGVVTLPAFACRIGSRDWRRLVGSQVVAGMAAAGFWLMIGGWGIVASFRYHAERGVEIGSLYAGILMAASMVTNSPIDAVYEHSCMEIVTRGSSALGSLGFPLQLVALGLVAWRARRAGGQELLRYSGAAVLAFVAFGKVLSPQYLIWPLPFVAVLDGDLGKDIRRRYLAACVMTTVLYPLGFTSLIAYRPWAVALLVCRNLLLVKMWYGLTFGAPEGTADGVAIRDDRRAETDPLSIYPRGAFAGVREESRPVRVRGGEPSPMIDPGLNDTLRNEFRPAHHDHPSEPEPVAPFTET